LAGIGRWV